MAKLYPPVLEGILPAFYSENDNNGDGIVRITIPFSMNRAVSNSQVGGFALKVKTVQSSSYLFTIQVTNSLFYNLEDSTYVQFVLRSSNEEQKAIIDKLHKGQFYKLQLAYLDNGQQVGYYSTVGVAKYTTRPEIHVNDFVEGFINMHRYEYTGYYSQKNGDVTERVYSYRFDVYDSNDKIIATSGDQLHDYANDVELYESYDTYSLPRDLEQEKSYRIKYTIKTNNGLEISTPRYRIMQKSTIEAEMQADIQVSLNYENGYVDVDLIGHKNDEGLEEVVTGSFLLTRSCEDSNYTIWDEISRFKLAAQWPSRWLWRDYTVEQGKKYQYSIQQYNDKNLYSNRLLSNIIYVDFEDAFLFDGERQLKIKYNPKVSSFKVSLMETKVNTIGNKHPFIFRNGRVYSHEFPISGLISYYMDEENLFLTQDEFKVEEKTTNLISKNITQERNFKQEVLKWLNNGNTKVFRSPGEGNFIIRLMNVSLTPTDSLNRMLHTFNATAYEMDDFTYGNLAKHNFIHLQDTEESQMRWETIEFTERDSSGKMIYKTNQILNKHPVVTVRFSDMMPGDLIYLTFEDDTEEIIQIGITGSYFIDKGTIIKAIKLGEHTQLTGSMTYSFYSIQSNLFDKIDNVQVSEVPVHQFIGEYDIIKEIEYVYDIKKNKWVKNPKIDIMSIYYLYAYKRSLENVVRGQETNEYGQVVNVYYQDKNKTIKLDLEKTDPFTLYKIGSWSKGPTTGTNIGYNPGRAQWTFNIQGYQDFYNNEYYHGVDSYQPLLQINDSIISVEEIETFDMKNPKSFQTLKSGNGVVVELSYQIRTIDYNIENNPQWNVLSYKKAYQSACQELSDILSDEFMPTDMINYNYDTEQLLREKVKKTYTDYILALVAAQEEEQKAEGLL